MHDLLCDLLEVLRTVQHAEKDERQAQDSYYVARLQAAQVNALAGRIQAELDRHRPLDPVWVEEGIF